MKPEEMIPEYLQYESVQRYIRQLTKNAAPIEEDGVPKDTLISVKTALRDYIQFTGKNPDELIQEAINQIKTDGTCLKINDQLDKFYLHYKSKTTASRQTNMIKGFYKHNGIFVTCKVASPPVIREKNRILTSEEIRAICDRAPLHFRALFLANNYLGLRVGAIQNLTVANFNTEEWTKNQPLYPVFISRKLSGTFSYTVYIGYDAMTVLKTYFKTRNFEPNDKPFNYAQDWINNVFKRCAYETGIINATEFNAVGAPKGINELRFHTLRMRRQTIQESVKTAQNWVDHIMGHIPKGADGKNYSHPPQKDIYQEILKALPKLEIYGHHEQSPTEATVEVQRILTLEAAKKLPNMTPEKLSQLENILKYTKTLQEIEQITEAISKYNSLEEGLRNITKCWLYK
ncbi:MAG: hypothetical protein NWE98_02155 [Candidatus Bathyarchaeota archaeon]|nr:hypothetical protein [Candidatus Bathyarchaeota archaeon]